MKFTDLSQAKQQLLKAFTEGETIEYYTPATRWKALADYKNLQRYTLDSGWIDTDIITLFLVGHPDSFRIKPKEPVVKLECFAIYDCGYVSNICYDSIQLSLDEGENYKLVVSWLVKTYINDVFIKAEIVQK